MSQYQRSFSMRAFVSLLLGLTFLGLVISGVCLYFAPPCRIAEQIGWGILGLCKEQWAAVHMVTALVFLVLAGVHLVAYNRRAFVGYMKRPRREPERGLVRPELIASLILAVILVAGSAALVVPFKWVPDGQEAIERYYREKADLESPDGIGERRGTGEGRRRGRE